MRNEYLDRESRVRHNEINLVIDSDRMTDIRVSSQKTQMLSVSDVPPKWRALNFGMIESLKPLMK